MNYAVHGITFKLNTGTSETPVLSTVSDIESVSLDVTNGIEEWSPLEAEGWLKKMTTAKSFVIGFNGKRNEGDVGNDFVASKLFSSGADVETDFEFTFPWGDKFVGSCVIEVTNVGDGDSTNVGQLAWNLHSNGKPTYTPAV